MALSIISIFMPFHFLKTVQRAVLYALLASKYKAAYKTRICDFFGRILNRWWLILPNMVLNWFCSFPDLTAGREVHDPPRDIADGNPVAPTAQEKLLFNYLSTSA